MGFNKSEDTHRRVTKLSQRLYDSPTQNKFLTGCEYLLLFQSYKHLSAARSGFFAFSSKKHGILWINFENIENWSSKLFSAYLRSKLWSFTTPRPLSPLSEFCSYLLKISEFLNEVLILSYFGSIFGKLNERHQRSRAFIQSY